MSAAYLLQCYICTHLQVIFSFLFKHGVKRKESSILVVNERAPFGHNIGLITNTVVLTLCT